MNRRRRSVLAAVGAAVAGCLGDIGDGSDESENGDDGQDGARERDEPDPDVESVSLLLNWQPSGLHVPYYAALERGFYDEHGLAVDIESGQGSDFSAQQAGLGNTEFAITSSDQIINANGRDLSPRSVGVVMQRGPVVLFSSRDELGDELSRPDQLEGLTVGSGPGMVRMMVQSYLEHHDLQEDAEYVDSGFDTVQQLLSGEIDVAGGVFSDAVDARHRDATVDVLSVNEAIPSYGHVVATSASFAEDNPDAVRAFLRGTARGAAWARESPTDAVDILVDHAPELSETRGNQRDKWEELASSYMLSDAVESDGWGWSESEPWTRTHETLRDGDFLEGAVEPDAVWTNEYLDRDYEYIGDYATVVSN